MSAILHLRVIRDDGVLLVERTVDAETEMHLVPSMGADDADKYEAARAEGHGVRVEVMDPDGDIAPAGEWTVFAEFPA